MARKNFLFASSQQGADALGVHFSLILTAEHHGLNPYHWECKILCVHFIISKRQRSLNRKKNRWFSEVNDGVSQSSVPLTEASLSFKKGVYYDNFK